MALNLPIEKIHFWILLLIFDSSLEIQLFQYSYKEATDHTYSKNFLIYSAYWKFQWFCSKRSGTFCPPPFPFTLEQCALWGGQPQSSWNPKILLTYLMLKSMAALLRVRIHFSMAVDNFQQKDVWVKKVCRLYNRKSCNVTSLISMKKSF